DLAGGIPFEVADRVWSYTYSTADTRSDAWEHQGTPLAGYGVGLPLSRLYAQYLGGSLHLMSMPGEGTTAFLHLKRLRQDAREQLPFWQGEAQK
ncbi:Pdk4, partial [Symbiodinium sp. KB8]